MKRALGLLLCLAVALPGPAAAAQVAAVFKSRAPSAMVPAVPALPVLNAFQAPGSAAIPPAPLASPVAALPAAQVQAAPAAAPAPAAAAEAAIPEAGRRPSAARDVRRLAAQVQDADQGAGALAVAFDKASLASEGAAVAVGTSSGRLRSSLTRAAAAAAALAAAPARAADALSSQGSQATISAAPSLAWALKAADIGIAVAGFALIWTLGSRIMRPGDSAGRKFVKIAALIGGSMIASSMLRSWSARIILSSGGSPLVLGSMAAVVVAASVTGVLAFKRWSIPAVVRPRAGKKLLAWTFATGAALLTLFASLHPSAAPLPAPIVAVSPSQPAPAAPAPSSVRTSGPTMSASPARPAPRPAQSRKVELWMVLQFLAYEAAVLVCALPFMLLIRWIDGSYGFQSYLARRRYLTATGKKEKDLPAHTRSAINAQGKRIADLNRANRANSIKEAWQMVFNRHPSDLAWKQRVAEAAAVESVEADEDAAARPGRSARPRPAAKTPTLLARIRRAASGFRQRVSEANRPNRDKKRAAVAETEEVLSPEDQELAEQALAPPTSGELFARAMVEDKKTALQVIKEAGLTPQAERLAISEFNKLIRTPEHQEGYNHTFEFIEWLLSLPWSKRSEDKIDLAEARALLDAHNFGLEKVKKRVLDFLAVRRKKARQGAERGKVKILCFVGPPGVGKTSIADDIAKAMGRKFVRVALGGVNHESKIRGFRRTYQGAQPGAILKKMIEAGTKNPVMLLDEVDKIGTEGHNGNPMDALLELLDPQQNGTFEDHYLEVPFDMSEVLFVVTANDIAKISGPLRDRLEIIEFSSYMVDEKIEIAQRHILPEMRQENALEPGEAQLTPAVTRRLIEGWTLEAGVRRLRQVIDELMEAVSAESEIAGTEAPKSLSEADLEKYLGKARVAGGRTVDNGVGRSTALYYSQVGGGTSNVIASVRRGSGHIIMRKQMAKMMEDSGQNVLDCIESLAKKLGLDPDLFRKIDVSVAFTPAMELDGPSAGITMTLAVASKLTGRAVKQGIAMTGEVTPDGRVLPIGGLREKVLGAIRDGYTTVMFPAMNERDAAEIPENVRAQIKLVPVKTMAEVLDLALETEVTEPLDVPGVSAGKKKGGR